MCDNDYCKLVKEIEGIKFKLIENKIKLVQTILSKIMQLYGKKLRQISDFNFIHIKTFEENPEIQVLNGRWGPYIKLGKNNYKIPKGKEAADLTYAETLDIIESQPDAGKKKGRFAGKKK